MSNRKHQEQTFNDDGVITSGFIVVVICNSHADRISTTHRLPGQNQVKRRLKGGALVADVWFVFEDAQPDVIRGHSSL